MDERLKYLMQEYCGDYNPKRRTRSYEILHLLRADEVIGLKDKDVLEVGGTLPEELAMKEIGAKSWCSIESREWNDLTNSFLSQRALLQDCKITDDGSKHLQLNGKVEDTPENMFGKFDRIISIASFEHITNFPRALDRMYKALKPGGLLYAFFAPIWSAPDGHHLQLIEDSTGRVFSYKHPGIPPWGHLLLSPVEMYVHLKSITDSDTADRIVHEIYNSLVVNRLFADDYKNYFLESDFSIRSCFGMADSTLDEEKLERLIEKFPHNKNFTSNGMLAVLEKKAEHLPEGKTMDQPLVTICVPVYNNAKYLDEAIASLLAQTYKNIEIIICDDSSTDSSYEQALVWQEKSDIIQVVRNDHNIGVTGNYNRLRSMANGKYVILHRANDTIAQTLVEKSVDYLNANPECGLVTAKTMVIDENGQFSKIKPLDEYYSTVGLPLEHAFLTVIFNCTDGDYNFGMIRRDILRKVQAYRWCGCPDRVFIAEISLYSQIHCLNEHLRYTRVQEAVSDEDCNCLSIRRVYRGRQLENSIDDIFLDTKFLHMAFEHISMLRESDIDEAKKSVFAEACIKLLKTRFEKIMQNECNSIFIHASRIIAQTKILKINKAFNPYERFQVEEMLKSLAMAQLVFPENKSIAQQRLVLVELLNTPYDGE